MDLVYSSDVYWRVVTIGNGPLGFGESLDLLFSLSSDVTFGSIQMSVVL